MHQRILQFLRTGMLAAAIVVAGCNPDEPIGPEDPAGPQLGGKPGEGCGGKECQGVDDRMTGGGKLGDGRDFATFGFNARPGQGQLEWVQHCLDGVSSSPTCVFGGFTFHGSTVTSYAAVPDDPEHCRTWTGMGEVKLKDPAMAAQYNGTYEFRVDRACDYGEPGHDTDIMSLTLASYHREARLTGGNIQLHPDKSNGRSAVIAEQGGTP